MFWRLILLWLIRRARSRDNFPREWRGQRVVTFDDATGLRKFLFWRYSLLFNDEWINKLGMTHNPLPWWCPINAFLHQWLPDPEIRERWHDHPRWSITICLAGPMIEHTPWGDNILNPGSIIFRTHKYIHAFSVPEGSKPWTLFIVGRRKYRQNSYVVTPR